MMKLALFLLSYCHCFLPILLVSCHHLVGSHQGIPQNLFDRRSFAAFDKELVAGHVNKNFEAVKTSARNLAFGCVADLNSCRDELDKKKAACGENTGGKNGSPFLDFFRSLFNALFPSLEQPCLDDLEQCQQELANFVCCVESAERLRSEVSASSTNAANPTKIVLCSDVTVTQEIRMDGKSFELSCKNPLSNCKLNGARVTRLLPEVPRGHRSATLTLWMDLKRGLLMLKIKVVQCTWAVGLRDSMPARSPRTRPGVVQRSL